MQAVVREGVAVQHEGQQEETSFLHHMVYRRWTKKKKRMIFICSLVELRGFVDYSLTGSPFRAIVFATLFRAAIFAIKIQPNAYYSLITTPSI